MKKLKQIAISTLMGIAFIFSSCDQVNNPSDNVPKTISELLASTDSVVDLSGADFGDKTEFNVTSGKTIKNADFNGKKLKINTDNVVLENIKNINISLERTSCLTIKNSDIKDLKINGIESSIEIQESSNVEKITINENFVEIKLTSKDSLIQPKIELIDIINDEISNFSICGGLINQIKVEKENSYPTITITGKTEIKSVIKVDENNNQIPYSVEITPEAKDDVILPEDVVVEEITLVQTEFVNNSQKNFYIIDESFDVSGFFVKNTYSNGAVKTIALTKENFTHFDSSKTGTITVFVEYDGKEIAKLNYLVVDKNATDKQKEEIANTLISSGIEKIKNFSSNTIDIDGVVADFRNAYSTCPNDKTRLFYALTEIASISVDESVAKLLKDNFGLVNYPATMNALITDSWFKEYKNSYIDYVPYKFVQYDNEWLIRVDGTRISSDSDYYYSDNSNSIYGYAEEEIVNGNYVFSTQTNFRLTNIKPSLTGKYLVYYFDFENYYSSYDKNEDYNKYRGYTTYDYDNIVIKTSNSSVNAPEFDSSKLKEQGWYQSSLFEGVETSSTLIMLLIGNLMNCNPNGFNNLIDDILNIFNTKFETARKIINEMSEKSVEIPVELLEGLNAQDLLGWKAVRLGKTEAQLLLVPFEFYKGLFQWISSYDLSLNMNNDVSDLPKYLMPYINLQDEILLNIAKIGTNNTLGVRNASAIESSKKTIINAINTVCNVYDYLISEDAPYPSMVKEALMDDYAKNIYNEVIKVKSSIEKGIVYTFDDFSINCQKIFTPGFFKDIYERDSNGQLQLYYTAYTREERESDKTVTSITSYPNYGFNIEKGYKTIDYFRYIIDSEKITDLNNSWIAQNTLNNRVHDWNLQLEFKVNIKLLKELLPNQFTNFNKDYIFINELLGNYSKDIPYHSYETSFSEKKEVVREGENTIFNSEYWNSKDGYEVDKYYFPTKYIDYAIKYLDDNNIKYRNNFDYYTLCDSFDILETLENEINDITDFFDGELPNYEITKFYCDYGDKYCYFPTKYLDLVFQYLYKEEFHYYESYNNSYYVECTFNDLQEFDNLIKEYDGQIPGYDNTRINCYYGNETYYFPTKYIDIALKYFDKKEINYSLEENGSYTINDYLDTVKKIENEITEIINFFDGKYPDYEVTKFYCDYDEEKYYYFPKKYLDLVFQYLFKNEVYYYEKYDETFYADCSLSDLQDFDNLIKEYDGQIPGYDNTRINCYNNQIYYLPTKYIDNVLKHFDKKGISYSIDENGSYTINGYLDTVKEIEKEIIEIINFFDGEYPDYEITKFYCDDETIFFLPTDKVHYMLGYCTRNNRGYFYHAYDDYYSVYYYYYELTDFINTLLYQTE